MKDMIRVNVMNEEVEVKIGTTLLELASAYQSLFQTPIVLAIVDAKLSELNQKIKEPCQVEFLDILNKDGFRTYQRSLSFVLIKAVHDVIGHEEHIKVLNCSTISLSKPFILKKIR